MAQPGSTIGFWTVMGFVARILGPEREFYALSVVYGVGISLLTLATPISVQMLINTVANTGLTAQLVVLSSTLFVLLLAAGLLYALRAHLMEIFARRFFARLVSEIAVRTVYAQNPFFADGKNSPLFNRFFDIIVVQKTIPVLFVGGFTVLLQVLVGFILVSLYHPMFLAFTLVTCFVLMMIWLIWGGAAVRTAIGLSHAKHATAAWLETLGGSNGFFKSKNRVAYALRETDARTKTYIDAHRTHFRRHFAQTVAFLVVYAAASAILLGLGGWLVIQGQFTLGQLVAAELVLSAAFFGVSQLGGYLTYFYDLCAAIEELSLFFDVAQEQPSAPRRDDRRDSSLAFQSVRGKARGRVATFNVEIASGAKVMAATSAHGIQRLFTSYLKRHVTPEGGVIAFGGADILSGEPNALRQEIFVLDRPSFIEMSIRDYLTISAEDPHPADVLSALRVVGLEPALAQLEHGLDTMVASTGYPLSNVETMQLKLAAALITRPRVLVLNQLFDMIDEHSFASALEAFKQMPDVTLIYFSNRRCNPGFEQFLYFDFDRQTGFDDFDDFSAMAFGARQQLITPQARIGAPDLLRLAE